ncbi:MAG: serine/threonine protein kinase, partial [Planctomycetales bacterium]
ASLSHPNIVQAYTVDKEGDVYYLVTEYVDGLDLEQKVGKDGPLPCGLVADYIRQATEGLAHAHGRGVIHRDVKPSNLMAAEDGSLKVLDMGLARLSAGDDPSSASNGSIVGTPDYISPEQTLNSDTVDGRADLYSLGCTMYFLLTAKRPFMDRSVEAVFLRHQTEPAPDARRVRADVPRELAELSLIMMAKKVEDRVQTATEVASYLAAWQQQSGAKMGGVVPTSTSGSSLCLKASPPPDSGGISDFELSLAPEEEESPTPPVGSSNVPTPLVSSSNSPTLAGSSLAASNDPTVGDGSSVHMAYQQFISDQVQIDLPGIEQTSLPTTDAVLPNYSAPKEKGVMGKLRDFFKK